MTLPPPTDGYVEAYRDALSAKRPAPGTVLSAVRDTRCWTHGGHQPGQQCNEGCDIGTVTITTTVDEP